MDANENVNDPKAKIAHIFNKMDLIDLHHHQYPAKAKPAMHQQDSYPVDLILGSPLLASALKHAWILPFGEPSLIKGDHRLLGADFFPTILFGSTTETPTLGLLHSINSKNDQHMQKYCKQVVECCNQYCLDECMAALMSKPTLSDDNINKLEAIDQRLTKILLQVDQQCCPLSTAPWSPVYKQQCIWCTDIGHSYSPRNKQNGTFWLH